MAFRSLLVLVLLLFPAIPGLAQQPENLGAHRFGSMEEFQRVIDTKCTVCHTRERVDIAIRNRKNLEEIEKSMISRGAALSKRDKRVLGTFWGDPLKKEKRTVPGETLPPLPSKP
jgi:hypothetical protein